MLFKHDFIENIDITKFRKQASCYIPMMVSFNFEKIKFVFNLKKFNIAIEIKYLKEEKIYITQIAISDVKRFIDIINGVTTISESVISPISDIRFSNIFIFQKIFNSTNHNWGGFKSNDIPIIIDTICELIVILFKINNLKAFT